MQESPTDDLKPRERLERRGARCLCDDELLAVLLDTIGNAKNAPEHDARKVLQTSNGSFFQLSRWEISDFLALGISWLRACNLVAAFEIGRRIEERTEFSAPLTTAEDIFKFFERKALPLDREKCWVLCTDAKNRVIRFEEITAGTATASVFHPRDFLRPAIRANASALALVHNHPSGDASPSASDIRITRSLAEACKIFDIRLLDHVIIGRRNIPPHTRGYFSFSDAGLLP
ncbi:MAG: DNA repair protein RadC [Opitutales bacterium]|nr:DNA repair protein RadC [Opitutales bacterium]